MESSFVNYKPNSLRTICLIVVILLISLDSCSERNSESVINDHGNGKARRGSFKKKKGVSWAYLREMVARSNNPSVYNFLKERKKITPLKSNIVINGSSNDPILNGGGTSPCDDPQSGEECNIDEGDIVSVRVDLPFRVDGKDMVLSIAVVYDRNSGQVVTAGSYIYGPGSPQNQSNYTTPAAEYTGGNINYIGNTGFQYNTGTEHQIGAQVGAEVTLPGGPGVNASLNGNSTQQYNMSNNGTIYTTYSINPSTGYGSASVQINGTNGVRYEYQMVPEN